MASPSTSTLRSGTVSRFSGGGRPGIILDALRAPAAGMVRTGRRRTSRRRRAARRGGAAVGRGGPPKLKLKNCADAGPTIPTSSATATANAISGPVSVNTRKKDFGFGMRSIVMKDQAMTRYNSGIRPQAGRFCAINRASAAAVKRRSELSRSRLLSGWNPAFQRPRSRSSTSEEANPSAGAPIEAWKPRSASRVSPPNWPSGVPR